MKKKVLLMTGIALVLLVAVIASAINAVFTVTKVELSASTCSDTGVTESIKLQEELNENYLGKSTTFLNLDDVKNTVFNYNCFELVSCSKQFPQKIVLQVSERKEVFAFLRENGTYAVLDGNGLYLHDSEKNSNRMGGQNILLEDFAITTSSAGVAATGEYLSEALEFIGVFIERLENARANILSVTLSEHPYEGEYFHIQMQEGVCVDVYTPSVLTRAKAEAALDTYLALSYEEKMYGYFDLMATNDNPNDFTVSRHYAEYPDV